MSDYLTLCATLQQKLRHDFAEQQVILNDQSLLAIREVGQGPTVILLHGISSGSASWVNVACQLAEHARVIAWDAPGYGKSTALTNSCPKASDYAEKLVLLINQLAIKRCTLVGHSLGALMAMATAVELKEVVEQVVLISPARGYGDPSQAEVAKNVKEQRLSNLAKLGVVGMAEQRAPFMLSTTTDSKKLGLVRWNMMRLNPTGYKQAVEMLCGDDLVRYTPLACPVELHYGDQDVITTPANCIALAKMLHVPHCAITDAGHASPIEQPEAVAKLIWQALQKVQEGSQQ